MSNQDLFVSVCIPCHSHSNEAHVRACVNSILEQTYERLEVRVVSQDEELYESIKQHFENEQIVNVHSMESDAGVSKARNICYEVSDGDIVAYIDADAVARNNWIEEIVDTYEKSGVSAVGGKATAIWEGEKPSYISENFVWIFGITHSSHAESGSIVRNTFGCNMTFKRDVLERLGGFDENLGKTKSNLQGEESEIGFRMRDELNKGVYYNASAIVDHRVEPYQTNIKWISDRAYMQGVSKAIIKRETSSNLSSETQFLSEVLGDIKKNSKNIVHRENLKKSISENLGSLYLTFLIGLGYLVERARGKTA